MGRKRPRRQAIDPGMQPERTTMAWERTGFSLIAAGAILARYGFADGYVFEAVIGTMVVIGGTTSTLWAANHYHDEEGPLRSGLNPVHPMATRLLGLTTVVASVGSLAVAVRIVIERYRLF